MPSIRRFKETVSVIRGEKTLGKTKAQIASDFIAARADVKQFTIERGDTIEWESQSGLVRFKVISALYFGKRTAHYQLQVKRITQ